MAASRSATAGDGGRRRWQRFHRRRPRSQGKDTAQTTLGIDPARAFNISVRMETCTLTAAGTKGKETNFTFPIVADNSSTFEQFRATIFAKYPWGLYDAVELRYWDVSKVAWVPVQSDNELGAMFTNNAETMSCNLEITVIERPRSQNNSNPTRSRPYDSKASAKARTNIRSTSSSCRPPTTPSANA
ncbi:histone-lysine n-methyltransferase atxr3 [Hordeum vulgare]|nr:histone-lysine n-methyltransferase atxr3 [Hordeum vulgare]